MQGGTTYASMMLMYESSMDTIQDNKMRTHLHSKLIYFLFLRQQRNQSRFSCPGPHKAADGHPLLLQHCRVESNEGLSAAGHGPLIWIQKGGAA